MAQVATPAYQRRVPPKKSGDPGVSDGARTRDILDHNQVLYQLSYTHQG